MGENFENNVRYKLMGGNIYLKPDVVPHKFDCQKDRKRVATTSERPVFQTSRLLGEVSALPTQITAIQGESIDLQPQHIKWKDVAVQVRPLLRSKSVMCDFQRSIKKNVTSSPIKLFSVDKSVSPIKFTKPSVCWQLIVPSSSSSDTPVLHHIQRCTCLYLTATTKKQKTFCMARKKNVIEHC